MLWIESYDSTEVINLGHAAHLSVRHKDGTWQV